MLREVATAAGVPLALRADRHFLGSVREFKHHAGAGALLARPHMHGFFSQAIHVRSSRSSKPSQALASRLSWSPSSTARWRTFLRGANGSGSLGRGIFLFLSTVIANQLSLFVAEPLRQVIVP